MPSTELDIVLSLHDVLALGAEVGKWLVSGGSEPAQEAPVFFCVHLCLSVSLVFNYSPFILYMCACVCAVVRSAGQWTPVGSFSFHCVASKLRPA